MPVTPERFDDMGGEVSNVDMLLSFYLSVSFTPVLLDVLLSKHFIVNRC